MIQSTILLALALIIVLITWNEVQGKDFLFAVHQKSLKAKVSIYADPGETGGMIQIQYPSYGYKTSRTLTRLSGQYIFLVEKIGTTSGIECNSILVTCSDYATKVLLQGNYFTYNVFSPLPLTALGTYYIVSSCDRTGQYRPFLVMATGAEDTDVDITFRGRVSITYEDRYYTNGDTLSLRLKAYQTFTLENHYDLTGTIVKSTQNIALFTGLMNTTSVVAYGQLLPIKVYSKEYVVAVNNNTLYRLQIISQDNGTLINFNNGTRVVVDGNGFYRRQLRQNEIFHFTTTRPVMTTLCRLNGEKSGFLAVPPVSRFKTQIRISLRYRETTAVVMTSRNTNVNISSSLSSSSSSSSVSEVWSNVPNSRFKVGIFRLVSKTSVGLSSDIPFTGAILFYQAYSIYSYGILTEDVAPVYSDTKGYILAFPQNARRNLVLSAVGEIGGFWQVQYPHKGDTYHRQTVQFYADRFYIHREVLVKSGVENKTIVVTANSDIHIACFTDYYYFMSNSFSPLPVSALGKKYIVPSCYDPYVNNSLLVVATGKEMADVHVTFKLGNHNVIYDNQTYTDGETLRVRLLEYQTLTIKTSSPLCGTTVSADRNVAVFSGTDDPASYMQILPVRLHGQEYVVAVPFHPYWSFKPVSEEHYILIVGEDIETQITLNDKQIVSLGERQLYQRQLLYNESLYFKSTKPVMVSLFMFNNGSFFDSNQYLICATIPPVSLYTNTATFDVMTYSHIQILTEKSTDITDIKRSIGRSWVEGVSVDWRDIPNSNYKVGIFLTRNRETLYMKSNAVFTLLEYGYDVSGEKPYSFVDADSTESQYYQSQQQSCQQLTQVARKQILHV